LLLLFESNWISAEKDSDLSRSTFFSSLTKNFSFFAVKLGHSNINEFFLYVTNTQAKQQKLEKEKKQIGSAHGRKI